MGELVQCQPEELTHQLECSFTSALERIRDLERELSKGKKRWLETEAVLEEECGERSKLEMTNAVLKAENTKLKLISHTNWALEEVCVVSIFLIHEHHTKLDF